MINLTNVEEIKKYDPKDVFGSTELFTKQCKQIHEQINAMEFSIDLNSVQNIVIAGMGGSLYGGHVSMALFRDNLKLPLYLNNDYGLPFFANEKTLVIPTSYSGSTEETVASLAEAKKKSTKIITLTSGGTLVEETQGQGELVKFEPKHNPSGQPRLGTGYIVLGTIEILKKLHLVDLTTKEIEDAVGQAEHNTDFIKQHAQEFAQKIQGNMPVIFAAEFLEGNAHILRNQFNETAKTFSSFHSIPEANHHLMEGLKNPEDRKLISLIIDSSLYSTKIKQRMQLTQDVVSKNNIQNLIYTPQGTTKLSQVLELLMLGGYVTIYLAVLYKQDPSLIPWVDYFKKQLK